MLYRIIIAFLTTVIYLLFYVGGKFGLALRELRGLRMVKIVALRKIFGPKKDEVTGLEKTT